MRREGTRRLIAQLSRAAALATIIGCGAQPASSNFAVETRGSAATKADLSPIAAETAKLARFWAIDRFFYDDHKVVAVNSVLGNRQLLAKAPRDGHFDGTTSDDAYAWGLVKAGKSLWFGTIANTLCYAQQEILGLTPEEDMKGYWYCGFGQTENPVTHELVYGDWRAPNLYRFDLGAGELVAMNPPLGSDAEELRQKTVGFRSAGASGGVVFLAGPAIAIEDGVVVFAFDAGTHALLGAKNFPAYANVRSWVNAGNDLYVGVGFPTLVDGNGGAVLRWVGSKDDPFQFETVGLLDTEAANLALHKNRIYVTTWPFFLTDKVDEMQPMSLWRSPIIKSGGLTEADKGRWKKLWTITDYDHDLLGALSTGGGAIASFGGRIYWGTMHVPFAATAMALEFMSGGVAATSTGFDTALAERLANIALGSHRSAAVFQGKETGAAQNGEPKFEVKLLYGEKYLPRMGTDGIYRIANAPSFATSYTPVHGASGVGNFFNAYIWAADTFDDNLWLGTFDWSQLARAGLQTILGVERFPGAEQIELLRIAAEQLAEHTSTIVPHEGADLFRFTGPESPAIAEDLAGLGNDTNYGIRTTETGEGALYIGTANAMNRNPAGGWELLELTP